MNWRFATLFALLLLPAGVRAQDDGFGLDLTQPPPQTDQKKDDQATPPATAPSDDAADTTDTTADDAPKADATRESLLEGERDVTVEDRVKSVQRKVYLKKHRVELAPYVTYAVNDPYYMKYGLAVRGAWYLADTLALSARFTWYNVTPTDDVKTAKSTFQSRIFFSVPQWSVMADAEWSPLYGKVAFVNDILHLDGYLLGGAGVVTTETSALPNRGPNPAVDMGLGLRFVAKDFLAVNVALINTSYVDQPAGTTKGATQNVMTLNAGVSIFFPFKSTGREAE